MSRTFSTAEDRIDSGSFSDIVAVLTGESPWKSWIRPATEAALKNIPTDVFEVLPPDNYKKVLAELKPKDDPNSTPGITNKKAGRIHLSGYFGTKSREAMLGHALHETVHLVSHQPGIGTQPHSSAIGVLGEGLLEGLVELITTEILTAQGIALAEAKRRGHQERVQVLTDLMRTYGITRAMLARPLFRGDSEQLFRLTETAFTTAGWLAVKQLTTANNTTGAIQRMASCRRAAEKAEPGGYARKLKQAGFTVTEYRWVFR